MKKQSKTTTAWKLIASEITINEKWNPPFQIKIYLIKLPLNVNIVNQDLLDMKHFWKFYKVRSKKFVFFIMNSLAHKLMILVLVFSRVAVLLNKKEQKNMFYLGTSLTCFFFQLCGLLLHGFIMGWLCFPNQLDSNARFYPNDLRKV